MKRQIEFITGLCILTILLTAGCGKIGANSKNVLAKYLDASLHGKYEEAYQCISTKDRTIKNLQEYLSEYKIESKSSFAEALTNKISYEIQEITITGNQAKANVAVTTPDYGSIKFTDIRDAAFMSAFLGGKDEKEIEEMITEKYKEKEIPMVTTKRTFDLVKESGEWKIFLNWETRKKVDEAMKKAKQFEKEKKLYAAKEKYQEALKLDSKAVEASRNVKELDKEIRGFEEKQEYISKVKLYAFEARYYKTYLDARVPGVEFKLKNEGDKTLTEVEVTVYFKDASGNVIAEEDYHPVLVSDFSFRDNKLLKPNYIWQMEQGKFYQAKSVPSEWQEGNAVAKITTIEFEE